MAVNPAADLFGIGVTSEAQLVRIAVALGATEVEGPLTRHERRVIEAAYEEPAPLEAVEWARAGILAGDDPLGEIFCRLRPAAVRRSKGAFYTPPAIVRPMVEWVLARAPERVVDAGCGSGRFAMAVALAAPTVEIVAVDTDPVATLLTRAALASLKPARALVLQNDYTTMRLNPTSGRTAFVGNPPYVRHHDLSPASKAWAARAGMRLGCRVSGLSGLHAHFYLATALLARPGDVGCLVTSAEWLDVGYGAAIRDLLLNGLGGQALHLVDFRAVPFEGAQATAVVACFQAGDAPEAVRLRLVQSPAELRSLDLGQPVPRSVLAATDRWTSLLKGAIRVPEVGQGPSTSSHLHALAIPASRVGAPIGVATRGTAVPLGSVARVHRGLVTGGNDFFVLTRARARELGLERWCRPAITAAREILDAGGIVRDGPNRKLLLDVPADIDRSAHPALDAYLRLGESSASDRLPVARGYICRHRNPWWYLGMRQAPPIVASYMARQAPAFALNPDGLALLNIGHGIFPARPLDLAALGRVVAALNAARRSFTGLGRTYQGGLEKFEPREMEALPVEWPDG